MYSSFFILTIVVHTVGIYIHACLHFEKIYFSVLFSFGFHFFLCGIRRGLIIKILLFFHGNSPEYCFIPFGVSPPVRHRARLFISVLPLRSRWSRTKIVINGLYTRVHVGPNTINKTLSTSVFVGQNLLNSV